MTDKEILNIVVAKVAQIHDRIETDYSKGKISFGEKNHSLFYTDELKYEIQKLIKSLSN